MKLNLLLALTLAFTACSTGPTRYQTEWENQKEHFLSQLIEIKCTPEEDRGRRLGACDSVTQQFYLELPEITKTLCKEGSLNKTCTNDIIETLFARFRTRYKYANWTEVDLWCQATPRDCNFNTWQDTERYEMHLLLSQYRNIRKLSTATRESIQAQQDLSNLQDQQAYIQSLRNQQTQSHQFRCVSTTLGHSTTTDCR